MRVVLYLFLFHDIYCINIVNQTSEIICNKYVLPLSLFLQNAKNYSALYTEARQGVDVNNKAIWMLVNKSTNLKAICACAIKY